MEDSGTLGRPRNAPDRHRLVASRQRSCRDGTNRSRIQSRLHPRTLSPALRTTPRRLTQSPQIDTAQIYRNESEVGDSLRGYQREAFFLTTKWSGLKSIDDSIHDSLDKVIHPSNRPNPLNTRRNIANSISKSVISSASNPSTCTSFTRLASPRVTSQALGPSSAPSRRMASRNRWEFQTLKLPTSKRSDSWVVKCPSSIRYVSSCSPHLI